MDMLGGRTNSYMSNKRIGRHPPLRMSWQSLRVKCILPSLQPTAEDSSRNRIWPRKQSSPSGNRLFIASVIGQEWTDIAEKTGSAGIYSRCSKLRYMKKQD